MYVLLVLQKKHFEIPLALWRNTINMVMFIKFKHIKKQIKSEDK